MKAAVERGCFLELNGHPDRLDLDDVHCQMAKKMGLKVALSTDAHSTDDLALMRFGIGQARRGWLEPADVDQHAAAARAAEAPQEEVGGSGGRCVSVREPRTAQWPTRLLGLDLEGRVEDLEARGDGLVGPPQDVLRRPSPSGPSGGRSSKRTPR